MSDSVNDYGLGAPNTQQNEPETTHTYEEPNPLEHGLGDQDVLGDDLGETGRRHPSHQEHGLGVGGAVRDPLAPGLEPDPLEHGLGSPDSPADDFTR